MTTKNKEFSKKLQGVKSEIRSLLYKAIEMDEFYNMDEIRSHLINAAVQLELIDDKLTNEILKQHNQK